MAHIEPVKTDRELYEDWKPLLEGIQDAEHDAQGRDERLEDEETWIEQVNGGRGVSAGGPGDSAFPVVRKPPRGDVDYDEIVDHDNDF